MIRCYRPKLTVWPGKLILSKKNNLKTNTLQQCSCTCLSVTMKLGWSIQRANELEKYMIRKTITLCKGYHLMMRSCLKQVVPINPHIYSHCNPPTLHLAAHHHHLRHPYHNYLLIFVVIVKCSSYCLLKEMLYHIGCILVGTYLSKQARWWVNEAMWASHLSVSDNFFPCQVYFKLFLFSLIQLDEPPISFSISGPASNYRLMAKLSPWGWIGIL